MIKLFNRADINVSLSIPGAAAVATTTVGRDSVFAPFNGYLAAYWATFAIVGVDGTGSPTQNVVVDILQNNVSIFTSTNANKINWAHASLAKTPTTYGVLVADPIPVVSGDTFEAQILQILNGTSPTQPIGLMIGFLFSRKEMSPVAATLTGGFLGANY